MFSFITTGIAFITSNWMRLLVYGLVITTIMGTFGTWMYMKGKQNLYEYQADQAVQGAKVVVLQGKITEHVITEYIKVQGETKTKIEYRDKEIIKYVDAKLDDFDLSNGAVSLLDSAASNTLPDPAKSTDGTPSGLRVAQAIPVVAGNYAICNKTADQLRGLQEWVIEQQKANP